MTTLRIPRAAALYAIAAIITAASLVAFAQSYRGLYLWAAGHGLGGLWAALWPLQVDTFVAVGELALFVALVDRWAPRSRAAAWTVTLAGLVVSVLGNVGHEAAHSLADRATAAVPPLAAAAALAVGLGVLKRVVRQAAVPVAEPAGHTQEQPVPVSVPEGDPLAGLFAPELSAGQVPGIRKIKSRARCGSPRAGEIRSHLETVLAQQSRNGHRDLELVP